ncbi:hypothetical protein MMA231_04110 (plasmid) [Asticcacaulis sp. MM231]|uniref:hypothetical protein n=1 Tax=Asticcacaulis sp. MM231 TaxID=3157666 RepID=UPI0032D58BE3
MIQWKVYPIDPADFGWDALPDLKETAARIAGLHAERVMGGYESQDAMSNPVNDFLVGYLDALKLAVACGCDGDMTEATRVFWLPMENDFGYAFVWQQGSKGETFIVSPEPLPWLDEHVHGLE